MFEPDPIRAALAEAQAAVGPLIQAPGVVATRSVLRRRRVRRAAVLATFVVLALGLGAFAAAPPPTPTVPGTEWSASPQPSELPQTATPSPVISSAGAKSAQTSDKPCFNQLIPKVENASLANGTRVRFYLDKPSNMAFCPGLRLLVGWNSYRYVNDGEQFHAGGMGVELTSTRPSYSDNVTWSDPDCHGDVYYTAGEVTIPAPIPAGKHASVATWSAGRRTGLIASKLTTNVCPTPIS